LGLPAEQVRAGLDLAQVRGTGAAVVDDVVRMGFKVELNQQPDRLAKQGRYPSRKGVPFVWFPPFAGGRPHEVKDMATGAQREADPGTWPG